MTFDVRLSDFSRDTIVRALRLLAADAADLRELDESCQLIGMFEDLCPDSLNDFTA